ncbi:hypothetical protein RB628_24815 [Streptomyces sp. ADMS]|nr:hypothetical protein [Streptomyces sp. ADMS]MDW4908472.1 hypothetical protein [Streptomyces sp. ADMS]
MTILRKSIAALSAAAATAATLGAKVTLDVAAILDAGQTKRTP